MTSSPSATTDPLVSILIPAYNAEAFLGDTLKSALAQTWRRKEIIVVDDGSKDGTLAVARQFESQGVTVIAQKNQGAAAARNTALSHSKGDFIQWLDADDLLNPEKVERQVKAAIQDADPRTLYSSGWAYFMYRPHKAKFTPTALWHDLSPIEWMTRKLELNLHMQTATWLVSRELTAAAGPWNTKLLGDDDGEYFARVLMASKQVRFVPESKVFYRISPSARLSHIGRSVAKMEAQFHSMELNIAYIRSVEDSARVRAACVTYLQRFLPVFYPEMPAIVKRAEELAASLGGKLETPRLSWKYLGIQKLLAGRRQRTPRSITTSARPGRSACGIAPCFGWAGKMRRVFDAIMKKLQIPSSKLQRSSKHQTSNYNVRSPLELEAWMFSGAWSLVFGVFPL